MCSIHIVQGTDIPVQKHFLFTDAHVNLRGVQLKLAYVTLYTERTTIRARAANKC